MNNKESVSELIKKYKRVNSVVKLLIVFFSFLIVLLLFSKPNVLLSSFKLNGEDNEIVEVNSEYSDKGINAKLYFIDLSNLVKVTSNVDTSKIGEYNVNYSINLKFLNIKKDINRKVIVKDSVSPILTVDSQDKVYIGMYENYAVPNYNATDNLDGDITSKVKIINNINNKKEGSYIVSYEVEDSSNNKSKRDIEVVVEPKYKHSYIVVNKSEQMLYYYENDILNFSTPVVTGYGSDTPLGTFYVNGKYRTAVLKGVDYETKVNYWIPFIGGTHGFHDATWRDSFGGDIYLYNPSHGCVNLPSSAAYELYTKVVVGTPVHIIE